jgi:5-methylcytosine-specific restriction endonuclease McrA
MITNCKKCGEEFDNYSKWGEKQFCSRKCANSRTFSDEAKLKKSVALKGRVVGEKCGLTDEKYQAKIEKYKKTRKERQNSIPFDKLGVPGKRNRVFEEQNYACNNCGLSNWMNQPITLELEHKDGDRENNTRENLEGLCPNCHSLTETWRGRKIRKNKIDNNTLLKCLIESKNIKQALAIHNITLYG